MEFVCALIYSFSFGEHCSSKFSLEMRKQEHICVLFFNLQLNSSFFFSQGSVLYNLK